MAKNILSSDTAVIASSGTTSTSVIMERNRVPLAIVTPAALTGTTIKFQVALSSDATTFYPLYDEGTEYSVTVSTSRYVALNPDVFQGVSVMRLVSGSSEAASRTISVVSGEL